MTTSKKLKKAQQRLKKAQDTTAKFESTHKGLGLTPRQETEPQHLLKAELTASADLTEAKKRPKPIRNSK